MSTQSNQTQFIRARGLDRIPLWKAAWRKWITFQHVSHKRLEGPHTQENFIARWTEIQNAAWRTKEVADMTVAFWKMESIGAVYGSQPPRGGTMNDPRLPMEIRPIAHTGMGVAAVEVGEFDPDRITQRIESLANPNFRLFAYESLGAMLGVHEMAVPKSWIGLKTLRRPQPENFIGFFSPEIQWLISHGYGRLLYFNSPTISSGLLKLASRPFLQAPAAVQGMAFAYAMVNHGDLWVVLETGSGFEDPELRSAFRNGLIYALEFWEWAWPGFLRTLNPTSAGTAELIAVAQQEVDSSLARGMLVAFGVGRNPLGAATKV